MKLVYMSPNAYQITKFITNLCTNNYEFTDLPSVEYSRHNIAIFKICKDDTESIFDIFNILSRTMIYRKMVETADNYYISMNMYDLLELSIDIKYNSFIIIIEKLCKSYYPFTNNRKSKYFNKDRLEYPIPYNYTLDMHILTDTRHLVSDYLNILVNNKDLTRQGLNELFTITFRLKCALIDERAFRRYGFIMDSPRNCNLYRGHLSFKLPEDDRELLVSVNHRRSQNGVSSEVLSLSKERIIEFIGDYAGKTKIDCTNILPNNTLTDIVCTMTIQDIIHLCNYRESYLISDVLDYLLGNVPNMDFIILGKEVR